MRCLPWAGVAALSVAVAACAGQPAGLPARPGTAPVPSGRKVAARVRLLVPKAAGHPSKRARGLEHQHFIAANVAGLQIDVYPHGSRVQPLASALDNVGSSSPLCVAGPSGRVCTLTLAVPPGGPDDVVVGLFDQAPAGNAPAGNQLGSGVTTTTIVAGKANEIGVTVGGIVSTITLLVPRTSFPALTPVSQNATVSAFDIDGNLIATDQYMNAAGNPVSIALAADANAGTAIAISPSTVTSPAPGGITIAYDSTRATTPQIAQGFTTVISATAAGVASSTASITANSPQLTQYPVPTGSAGPDAIVAGPDGALWFTEDCDKNVGRVTTAGSITELPIPNEVRAIAPSDGALWLADHNPGLSHIYRITTAGAAVFEPLTGSAGSVVAAPAEPVSGSNTAAMTQGSDGATWFTECGANQIGRITTGGVLHEYPVPTSSSYPRGITTGPDGAVWFTEWCGDKIGRIGLTGNFTEYKIPTPGALPTSIVTGPDGALWFAENSASKIGRITTSGGFSEFPVTFRPLSITTGPDGALWFTEPLIGKIGRLTTGGSLYEFSLFFTEGDNITRGPDGALWFTEDNANKVARMQ